MTYLNALKHFFVGAGITAAALIGGCNKEREVPIDVPSPTAPLAPAGDTKKGPFTYDKHGLPSLIKKLPKTKKCEPLDVMVMLDNTSSMRPYIHQAQQKGVEILTTINKMYPKTRFAVSTVADFSAGDIAYDSRIDFNKDISKTVQAIRQIGLSGGGDAPEAYPFALRMASNENWRSDAYRLVVLIADSVAHDKNKLHQSVINSNADLAVLMANEHNVPYWKSETNQTLPLASSQNLPGLILRSVMESCGDYPEVKYDTAKFDLSDKDKAELDKLVTMLKNKKNLGVQIDGHTDHVGANFRNDILGLNRAQGVAAYLNERGIFSAAASYGEVKPLCTTDTDDCKSLNRRSHLYPISLTPKTRKIPQTLGDFKLAKVNDQNAVYTFLPTSSRHFGSTIAAMFNKLDTKNQFRNASYHAISHDPDGLRSAGDSIRKFEPVYLTVRNK